MARFERGQHGQPAAAWLVAACVGAAALLLSARAASAAEEAFGHQAAIVVEQAGAFVRLPLPVPAYARSRQAGLADLRIVDARGERVPFALLAPRAPQASESARAAELYPLPARQGGDKDYASPIEVQVVGDRITVRRAAAGKPRTAATPASASGSPSSASAPAAAPGWLFDLGEPVRDERAANALRLQWSGPREFSVGFELELSDDLRQWRRAGGGQLLALQSATGHLTQRLVPLPGDSSARFVRLRWVDAAQAPNLTAAEQLRSHRRGQALDAPTELVVQPSAEPPPATALGAAPQPVTAAAAGALHYDLGAVLPLMEFELTLAGAHRVAPVHVQGRSKTDEPWRELAQTVFYRLERGGEVDRPPPLALPMSVRYLRLVPDPRSGPLPPATPLVAQAQLTSLVFAAQGQPPYRLLAGSANAAAGALPLATLVPSLEQERARFGRATLGPWSVNEAVAREEALRQQWVRWRPVLLWALLLVGVAGLGAMVWRLARQGDVAPPSKP